MAGAARSALIPGVPRRCGQCWPGCSSRAPCWGSATASRSSSISSSEARLAAARTARFRRYLMVLFAAIVAPLAVSSAFMVAVDPLWIAPFDTGIARYYCIKDERQNKTDKLAFGPEAYDALLAG